MKSNAVRATDANRSFARLLRRAMAGEQVEITSHGHKVAVLSPAEMNLPTRQQRLAALAKLEERWATQKHITVGPWTRDDLNERNRSNR